MNPPMDHQANMDTPRPDNGQIQANRDSHAAPWYQVPSSRLVGVDHPGIIQNLHKAVQTLGGPEKLNHFLRSENGDKSLPLRLRPDDMFSRPIPSMAAPVDAVLLKISVPKRTGRKRKRGSDGPFLTDAEWAAREDGRRHSDDVDEPHVLRSMRDHPDDYSVEPVGVIRETHRFRTIPEFEFASSFDPLYNEMRKFILPMNVDKMKQFELHTGKTLRPGATLDLAPNMLYSTPGAPHNWAYHQNQFIRWATDPTTGEPIPVNVQAPDSHALFTVDRDDQPVPTAPPPGLEPEERLDENSKRIIRRLREAFNGRPLMTRRVIYNLIPNEIENQVKSLLQYVAFTFPHGPWRDALVIYGADPRKDPKYRVYQTMQFKIPTQRREIIDTGNRDLASTAEAGDVDHLGDGYTSEWLEGRTEWRRHRANLTRDADSHHFDGNRVIQDGRVWQVCDVTDPLISSVLATENLRTQCDTRNDGWYYNGTWAKARTLMRDKITQITNNKTPDDSYYDHLIYDIPDIIGAADASATITRRPKDLTDRQMWLASQVRSLARLSYKMPNRPRAWEPKGVKGRGKQREGLEGGDVEGADDDEDLQDDEVDHGNDDNDDAEEDGADEDEETASEVEEDEDY